MLKQAFLPANGVSYLSELKLWVKWPVHCKLLDCCKVTTTPGPKEIIVWPEGM